jgi:hypothetical protein
VDVASGTPGTAAAAAMPADPGSAVVWVEAALGPCRSALEGAVAHASSFLATKVGCIRMVSVMFMHRDKHGWKLPWGPAGQRSRGRWRMPALSWPQMWVWFGHHLHASRQAWVETALWSPAGRRSGGRARRPGFSLATEAV